MKRVSAILLATAMVACASPDWGSASLRLQQGMTEQEAIKAVGSTPDKAQVTACGGNAPWRCRMLFYDTDGIYKLIVYEANVAGTWRVDSWMAM